MIIFLIILLIGGFFGVAILFASMVVHARSKAKIQARAILDGGEASPKKLKQIKGILATARNDTEAIYLWQKLEEFKLKP